MTESTPPVSAQPFREIVDGAPDGVVVLRWPHVAFINAAAARCLGFTDPAEAIGVSILDRLAPAEASMAQQRAGSALGGGGQGAPMEYTGQDPEGRRLTVEVAARPIEYEGAPAMLAFVRDVTDRKHLQAQLQHADRLAVVGALAAGVAHEINNPLAYLMLNLERLQRDVDALDGQAELGETMRARLATCVDGAARVRNIVRDLQDHARRDEELELPVDLAEVVRAMAATAEHQLPAHAGIELILAAVPPVVGNRGRLEQLVLNLLINAGHAVREGGERSGCIAVEVAPLGDARVLLVVRDDGAGIPEHILGKVFDPFFTTKPPGVGTGLGLAICNTIVRACGGHIEVQSEPGVGTSVTVQLAAHGSSGA